MPALVDTRGPVGAKRRDEKSLSKRELIVVGDRVLVKVSDEERRTEVGLYLPQSVADREEVLSGEIVRTGRGTPLVDPATMLESPWRSSEVGVRYMPMEAKAGDHALFLRKAAVEIDYEGQRYYLLPQSGILVLLREPGLDEDEMQ